LTETFLSVVIPAYNEEPRIGATLEQVTGYLSSQHYSWELLVVDDGSSDRTAAIAMRWAGHDQRVRVETVPHGGKGWAVRHGMLATAGQYRFMCDADMAMPIEQLDAFLARIEEGYDIVIGSRQKKGARRVCEPILRHVIGRVFNWTVRMLTVRDYQDTQCGYKCFRDHVAEELFNLQRTRGFAFDVEVLYVAAKRKMRVLELPIEWYYRPSSKLRPHVDSFSMLRDTILLRLRNAAGKYSR